MALTVSGCHTAGPFTLDATHLPDAPQPFSAGFATVACTPSSGYPLGGYGGGARRDEFPLWWGQGVFGQLALAAHQAWHDDPDEPPADLLVEHEGAHEDLTARALVLAPEGGPLLALVRLDAIGIPSELHGAVVQRVRDLGLGPATVILCATHTHAGPGSFFRAPFACLVAMDAFRPELEAALADACAEAIHRAWDARRPAELAWVARRDRDAAGRTVVAKNRRARRFDEIPYDATDDTIGLLLVRERGGGAPLGAVVNFAVHPTVLGSDNLHYSRDLAGGIERALEERWGVPALFVNGAEGDTGPQRIQARGGLLRCRELGEALAEHTAGAWEEGAFHDRLALGVASGTRDLGAPFTAIALARERFVARQSSWGNVLTAPLWVPATVALWLTGFTNLRVLVTWSGGVGVWVDLDGLVDRTITRIGAVRLRCEGAGLPDDVVWLTIPGEATHDVGLAARDLASQAGATHTFVVGLAQDHVGYLASPLEYRRGGYEAWSTLFGERSAPNVLSAHRDLLAALGYSLP